MISSTWFLAPELQSTSSMLAFAAALPALVAAVLFIATLGLRPARRA